MCSASPRNTLRAAAGLPALQRGVRRDGTPRKPRPDTGPKGRGRIDDSGMGPKRRSLFGG